MIMIPRDIGRKIKYEEPDQNVENKTSKIKQSYVNFILSDWKCSKSDQF